MSSSLPNRAKQESSADAAAPKPPHILAAAPAAPKKLGKLNNGVRCDEAYEAGSGGASGADPQDQDHSLFQERQEPRERSLLFTLIFPYQFRPFFTRYFIPFFTRFHCAN